VNESLFARAIKKTLDAGLELRPEVAARLEGARERALDRRRTPARGLVIAGPAQIGLALGIPTKVWSRVVLPAVILAAVVVGVRQWQEIQQAAQIAAQQAAEIEEVDTKLLTGDLPIKAYLDEEFQAWLKRSSE
jgi:hypothetical protein